MDCFSLVFPEEGNVVFDEERLVYIYGSGTANPGLRSKRCCAIINGVVTYDVDVDEFGGFELDVFSERVILGIPYEQKFETLPLDLSGGSGQTNMEKTIFKKMMLRLYNSYLPEAGYYVDGEYQKLYDMKNTVEYFGLPNKPKNGFYTVSGSSKFGLDNRVIVSMKKPMPMTILSIGTEVTYK